MSAAYKNFKNTVSTLVLAGMTGFMTSCDKPGVDPDHKPQTETVHRNVHAKLDANAENTTLIFISSFDNSYPDNIKYFYKVDIDMDTPVAS